MDIGFDLPGITAYCRQEDVEMLGVLGSVAREQATPDSDVDLLVRFRRTRSLLQIVRIERELGDIIGRRIDLLTEAAISPYPRDRVLRELRVLYAA
jgi:hypothetical protein